MAYDDPPPTTDGKVGRARLRSIGQELKDNPPKVLEKTRRKKGAKAANKQRVAILLSKARQGRKRG